MALKAIALNCTLKKSGGEASSTDRMIELVADALARHRVTLIETIRIADHDVKPGVSSDEGDGDSWPAIRAKILSADILIFATPIWLGQMSSFAKRVLERMDAFLDETDAKGRMPSYGKVALAAIVGNEDGAHGVSAHLFQGLNDMGWTLPSGAVCYWVGEAMGSKNFKDFRKIPENVVATAAALASNAAHLARLLQDKPYPGIEA
jgi:multimeric flavodoxin WrbA